MIPHLIKVGNDLVEKPQTLQALLVDVTLGVKLLEVRHGGEHHTHAVVRLIVEILWAKTHDNGFIQVQGC